MGVNFCEKTGAWLDGYLITWMDHLKDAVNKNWDSFVLIDGVEGSGKSSLAFTLAYYVDRSFKADNVVFTPDEFIKAVDKAKPKTAIVWDEFVMGGLGDDAMTQIQRTLIKKMVTMRKKNLYIFLVIPYIFMLRTYFAVGRSRMLINVFSPDGLTRGKWKLYNYQRKKDLYFKGKKFFEYKVPHTLMGDFGNYTNWNIIDDKEYQKRKDQAMKSIDVMSLGKREQKYREALKNIVVLMNQSGVTQRELSQITKFSNQHIKDLIREFGDERKQKPYINYTKSAELIRGEQG